MKKTLLQEKSNSIIVRNLERPSYTNDVTHPRSARAHLEAQFEPWMGWENYGCGKNKWIDIFNTEDVKRIFHYTNMQPLEFVKNSTKGKT